MSIPSLDARATLNRKHIQDAEREKRSERNMTNIAGPVDIGNLEQVAKQLQDAISRHLLPKYPSNQERTQKKMMKGWKFWDGHSRGRHDFPPQIKDEP
ncbi:hypothetical protein NDU88_001811 [Pleurodeles waltl]|uniref:Uncharacterized protein n=1 Tax=Pleurodeles waltl TaxID=8319 RepID=A0AAV7W0B3_PLEWA|nr:hypothetical protein NDU88_001811 [Pleurodeles waltl]